MIPFRSPGDDPGAAAGKEAGTVGSIRFCAEISPWYYAAAVLLGLAVGLWKRRWTYGLLAGYVFFIFSLAVLARSETPEAEYMLRPFWSYLEGEEQGLQILANVLIFVPLGYLLALLVGWRAVPAGAGFSVLIELLQLLTHRGMFEFDDMIHNSLGTFLGAALAVLILRRRGQSRGD